MSFFPPVAKVAIEEKVETKKVEMKEETRAKGTSEPTKALSRQIIFRVWSFCQNFMSLTSKDLASGRVGIRFGVLFPL